MTTSPVSDTAQHVGGITLKGMLPAVFAGDPPPRGDVWRTDLELERGRFYLIEARSGAGKSSLCAYLYGLRTDFTGSLLMDGRDTSGFSPAHWQQLRRRHLGWLPQELGLFPNLTALENIQVKNRLTGYADTELVMQRLEALGIADRAGWPAGRLSVGQRQRTALVRALCQPFDFLLLDEPVSHLDRGNNLAAARMVAAEARRQGAAVVVTSVGNPLLLDYDVRLTL